MGSLRRIEAGTCPIGLTAKKFGGGGKLPIATSSHAISNSRSVSRTMRANGGPGV